MYLIDTQGYRGDRKAEAKLMTTAAPVFRCRCHNSRGGIDHSTAYLMNEFMTDEIISHNTKANFTLWTPENPKKGNLPLCRGLRSDGANFPQVPQDPRDKQIFERYIQQ